MIFVAIFVTIFVDPYHLIIVPILVAMRGQVWDDNDRDEDGDKDRLPNQTNPAYAEYRAADLWMFCEEMRIVANITLSLAILLTCGCSTYRFRTERSIQRSLFKRTPVGSSPEQVLSFLEGREHGGITVNEHPAHDRGPIGYTIAVGKTSLGPVNMGWYWFHFPGFPVVTHVFASWAFDANNDLIDILVHKENDGP